MLLEVDTDVLLKVFGRFHVVLLHLPIGLIPAMAVLEFGAAIFRRDIPRGALITLAVMTALCAAAAFGSGWVLAAEQVDSELLGQHKNFAIAMASVCVLLPILAPRQARGLFRLALVAAMALSIVTGHLGGSLTHKQGFLFKPLERALEQQRQQVPAGGAGEDPDGAATTGPDDPPKPTRYVTQIQPIFERACTSCHNPDDGEGDLDLTTRAKVLEGWGDEKIVIPGKPDQSILIESLLLPLDDEMHMPPKDEEQLTPAEIETLRAWIADGAPE